MSKIIVIEEDGAMRVLISEWLASEGHEVRSLMRHGGPFDAAADATVDLVVLDLPHPRSRGGDTARAVHAVHDAYPHSSIIGISTQVPRSLGSDSDVARALGVSRLLAKPCTREELLDAVVATLAE
ncbi:response regulator [Variovorax sp. J22P271]|uniref:response regulator n=1 Tax=Variovorax davisae TaxID=3053515 RepID=UPI00257623D6|nr:response regulator [Variovorax sp. J22P271]MDM0036927.1 response regulator [Variovorax sp. J22P271]